MSRYPKGLGVGLAVFATLAMSLRTPAAGAAEFYRFAAPAVWIAPIEPRYDAPLPAGNEDASSLYQLFDRQIDIGAAGDDSYQHVAIKVLNATGVSDYSQIDLVVNPAFQSLDIHRLRVVRNGQVIDQKKLARITELPQETELRNRVYNGRYNINIELADVRPGDVVEYAYTLHSREILFPGLYHVRIDTGWNEPIHRHRIRVRVPLARPLVCRASDGSPVPAPVVLGDRQEFVVDRHDLAPVPYLSSTPGWYPVWPYLEFGDRISWADVARTVEPLFRRPAKTGPGVAQAFEAIRGPGGTPAAQALRALQYVQEEIRYTSMAIGRGSFEPAAPELVLERRFGDCKDKSLLLATLLGRLDVEARVALVHSSRGRALDDMLPTPYAFDHAIVRAVIDGAVYWLDPTAATQYEPLSSTHHPDFERALPVDPATTRLDVIPAPAPDMRRKEITATIDASAGMTAPGTLEVTTLFKGALADEMRPSLTSGSAKQRQVDYESYTAHYYPGARSLGPIDVDDDRANGVLTVKEHYRLENPFSPNAKGVLEFAMHADEIYDYAEPLGAGARQAPLALEYPIEIRQRVIASLPDDWPVKPGVVTVDNPAFRYRSQIDYADRKVTLDYEYQALASQVAPQDIARFETDRARVYDDLGYILRQKQPAPSGGGSLAVAPVPMLVLIFALAFAIWAAVRWGYRYDPPAQAVAAGGPVGIGGWLLPPAFSMIAAPFVVGWIAISWLRFVEADLWHGLPEAVNAAYAGSAHLTLLVILALSVMLTVASVLTAVLFFSKRTSAPTFVVALNWGILLLTGGVTVWTTATGLNDGTDLASGASDVVRGASTAIAWTAYMLVSRRVKATFVRRRSAAAPAAAAGVPEGIP